MTGVFEGRPSDSPYIHMIWRGYAADEYFPVCPADGRWNMLLLRYDNKFKISVEGPTTKSQSKYHPVGVEWLVIKFELGVFIDHLPVPKLVDREEVLANDRSKTFGLNGFTWQFPDFDTVEVFIDRLVHEDLLMHDPLVDAVRQNHQADASERTIRRRFLQATGLTPKGHQQIERAQYAMLLLEQGKPILDAVYDAGYADQAHMTRSLKHYIGYTPGQLAYSNEAR